MLICSQQCVNMLGSVICTGLALGMLTHWSQNKNWRMSKTTVFKCIFMNENMGISSNISLNFVYMGQINNILALVHITPISRQEPIIVFYWRIYALLGLSELIGNIWHSGNNFIAILKIYKQYVWFLYIRVRKSVLSQLLQNPWYRYWHTGFLGVFWSVLYSSSFNNSTALHIYVSCNVSIA